MTKAKWEVEWTAMEDGGIAVEVSLNGKHIDLVMPDDMSQLFVGVRTTDALIHTAVVQLPASPPREADDK